MCAKQFLPKRFLSKRLLLKWLPHKWLLLGPMVAVAWPSVCPAEPANYHLGLVEYELSCLPCHGLDGRGDGPLAKSLKRPPSDLTRIAKANRGSFPARRMAEIIDGRAHLALHGDRDMPAWGVRYRRPAAGETSAQMEKRVRTQIDALVRYLRSIQQR